MDTNELLRRIDEARAKGEGKLRLSFSDVDDANLKTIAETWPQVGGLILRGNTRITDAGLAHLKGLTALQTLDLSLCSQVTDAGLAHLKGMTDLRRLELALCKQITDAGLAHLKGMTDLRNLDLTLCKQITDAGLAHLKGLAALQSLNLTRCEKITDAGLAHLKGLTALQLLFLYGSDKITDVGLAHLKGNSALQSLGVTDCNQITTLPSWLRDRPLIYLSVIGIPALDLPNDVVWQRRNPQAILDHYFNRERPLLAAKLLLLGDGRAGKTHVKHRLTGGDPRYFTKEHLKTTDIDMKEWTQPAAVDDKGEQDVALYVWDFGGQPHLHATHRFFLGEERNLYLLVLDAACDEQENHLDYWLRMIRESGKGAPVIVLVTKRDAPVKEQKLGKQTLKTVRDRFGGKAKNDPPPNVVAVIEDYGWSGACEVLPQAQRQAAQARHAAAHEKLRQAIRQALPQVKGLTSKYPRGFHEVRDDLMATLRERKYVRVRAGRDGPSGVAAEVDYAALCERPLEAGAADVRPRLSQEQAKLYLPVYRNLGLAHYVGDSDAWQGQEVAHYVFSPRWVTGPAYALLWARQGEHRGAVLTLEQVRQLLPDRSGEVAAGRLWEQLDFTDDDRRRVLELMIACEVCFEVEGRPKRYLVPDLLPAAEKKARWDDGPQPIARCRVPFPFLADGNFLAFIGQHYARVVDPQRSCFRDEVVVQSVGRHCEALVQYDGTGLGVEVAVRGGSGEERMHFLSDIVGWFFDRCPPEGNADEFRERLVGEACGKGADAFALPATADRIKRDGHVTDPTLDPWADSDPNQITGKKGFEVNKGLFEARYKGQRCKLSRSVGFDLLLRLARSPGTYISFGDLANDVWKGKVEDTTITTTKYALDKKLKAAFNGSVLIDGKTNPKHLALVLA